MKIICIGRNYAEHAKELNNAVPEEPVYFMKPNTALLIRNRPFYYPDFTKDLHYECEIVLKIGKVGKCIGEEFALSYIESIGIGIDFTARDLQAQAKAKGLPWEKAKGFDNSAPISNFIPVSEFKDITNIEFSLLKNGQLAQQGNTQDMIFSYAQIIAYVSQFMTLKTGDYIFTGTPSGVGPVAIGDKLEAFIGSKKMLSCSIK